MLEKEINPRIGRQVKHFERICLKKIKAEFSDCMKYRYLLKFSYKNGQVDLYDEIDNIRSKTLTIILKNPSSADEDAADNTIRRVQTYVYKNFKDVSTINILNLFGLRATDAKEVNTVLKEHDQDFIVGRGNEAHIVYAVSEADYIITAWGGNSGIKQKVYDSRISDVIKLIKKHKQDSTKVYRVNPSRGSEIYPFHACFWGNDFKFIENTFEDFKEID